MSWSALAEAAARGNPPPDAELLKRSPVRAVFRSGEAVLKVFLRRSGRAQREARVLERAAVLGVPVPELLAAGPGWLVTRFVEGREARRADLERILPVVRHMHAVGMLHGDLHLGNISITASGPVLLDVQRARFLRFLPALLRRRELGYLAHSLGDPLPEALEGVRFWRDWRAQRHWRSRTKRCLVESSAFTAFGVGFRRRDEDPGALEALLLEPTRGERIKERDGGIYRHGARIAKQHRNRSRARAAWIGAQGLEARGIRTARALAWRGRWLVMEDAGRTLSDWVEASFERARPEERAELARALGELLACLHRRGVYHADLKANNICWTPGRSARLLDYGKVRFGWRVPQRRRIKNLAQLNAALPDSVPDELREQAFRHYLRLSEFAGDADRLRSAVIHESLRRAHRWTGLRCSANPTPDGVGPEPLESR